MRRYGFSPSNRRMTTAATTATEGEASTSPNAMATSERLANAVVTVAESPRDASRDAIRFLL